MGTSIRGTAVRRVEDPHFLTGDATYIDNLTLPGALQVVYVRSVVPHARVTSIDVSDALAVPGVVAVYTWPDLGIDLQRPLPFADQGMSRALLAHDVVRFVVGAGARGCAAARLSGGLSVSRWRRCSPRRGRSPWTRRSWW